MSISTEEFARRVEGLKTLETRLKEEAMQRAKDRAAAARVSVYQDLVAMIEGGTKIAKICKDTGLSRSTIYRWVDEAKEVDGLGDSIAAPTGWQVEHVAKATGDVTAVSPEGEKWLLNGDTEEAWNKDTNSVLEGFNSWPTGAKSAFDTVSFA